VTTRLLLVACAFGSLAFSQNQALPTYQWVKEVDASGTDSLAGLGTDAQGNIYIAGTTMSASYPTKAAVQGSIASAGLYRIAQSTCPVLLCLVNGSISTALGLNSASAIAVDPQNASTVYAVSARKLVKSSDGGITFSATSLPSSQANSIALEPGNSQVLFVATLDQGVLKSADGGATWTAVNNGMPVQTNGQVSVEKLWIDPSNPAVILARMFSGALVRSADGAATWQLTTITDYFQSITFDTANPGVLYVNNSPGRLMKSTDYGQTFTLFSAPMVSEVLPDQNHPGQLIGVGPCGVCLSTDGGTTWTQESANSVSQAVDLAPDWQNDVIYAAGSTSMSVVRISGDLHIVTPVGPPATGFISGLAVANGQVYAANPGSGDVFVTKLDPLGNIVYSTYLGGSGNDGATAMAVDATGNVFVAGTTGSLDFPVSKGAYASSGNVFVFKLNPDGSLGYSTYFSGTTPLAIATDGSGSAWLGGNSQGGLPVTPGALSTTCSCGYFSGGIGPGIFFSESSLTRFDAAGASLIFSTYVAGSSATTLVGQNNFASPLAVTPDGTAYLGGAGGVFQIDRTGTSLLSSIPFQGPVAVAHTALSPLAMTVAPDGSLYIAGAPGDQFQPTAGAFQSSFPGPPQLPLQVISGPFAVERIDAGLKGVIEATYFSNPYSNLVSTMAVDGAGNLYLGGSTAPFGLPTRTPFAGGFASPTGFMSELSGDLSTLVFSSYFGDTENFTVSGLGIGANGSVVIGGVTGGNTGQQANLWLNSLALAPPPALRIDAVVNAASLLDVPISAGETIVIKGAGFGSDARISIGDDAVTPLSIAPTAITATVPADVSAGAAAVQVQSGGASSNSVLMPAAVASPGIFSADGTGYGQGYILNKDGTLNTAANPAAPGDMITIMATGVGPVSFTDGYAVTEFPANVFIDGIYCDGVAAVMGPVSGFPGNVYRITVYVPNPAVLFATTYPEFKFPPLSGVVMQINGVSSQAGIAISIAQ
jgi:uncharacterized protein (TIGR03437 family)